jgi:hypothetical protein
MLIAKAVGFVADVRATCPGVTSINFYFAACVQKFTVLATILALMDVAHEIFMRLKAGYSFFFTAAVHSLKRW